MIVDFSVGNFRSIQTEQTLSMNVEGGRSRLPNNYTLTDDGKLAVLRSAAIFGANASGKTNLLRAIAALKWLVVSSGGRKEGQRVLPYEPFKLAASHSAAPVHIEVEFVVRSGARYQYSVSFRRDIVLSESLFSYGKRQRAMVFQRDEDDSWETVKFGATYKGGNRKFPFFPNSTYLSRAGNDASAPASIREIYEYFRELTYVGAGHHVLVPGYLKNPMKMKAVTDLICLADTGVSNVTAVENDNADEIKLPENMPDEVKEMILEQNSTAYKFWVKAESGDLVEFDQDDMSDGTVRLFEILPLVLDALASGSALLVDEMDAHLHSNLLSLLLQLFHDSEINSKGAQLIFTTHDTNVLDSDTLRRDQIWFVSKDQGVTTLMGLDEYDKRYVRPDSPFEAFYKDGRLGALPRLSYADIRNAVLSVVDVNKDSVDGRSDA